MNPFTNTHIHVFNTRCAPDKFLRVISQNIIRKYPDTFKSIIDSKFGRGTIRFMFWLTSRRDEKKRREFEKYVAFLEVAGSSTQQQVFEKALHVGKSYDPDVRIVGLTINMDMMDTDPNSSHINFETQVEEVKQIKRYYPKNFFPFLSIDPRHKSGVALRDFCRQHTETGTAGPNNTWFPYFSGLKLYPALGYFPFDPRLFETYQYAQDSGLPVMTHTTRVGSQYIGNQIENLVPLQPDMIMPAASAGQANRDGATAARHFIYDRIAKYYAAGLVRNSDIGDNDAACDLFGNPENYIPVLESFPNLKLCMAHMGGTSEIVAESNPDAQMRKIRTIENNILWFDRIVEMMKTHKNLYTDISYTLSDLDRPEVRTRILDLMNTPDNFGELMGNRVLFGTDFFMTEQENRESELFRLAKDHLGAWFDAIARTNAIRYMGQPV